MTAVGATIVVVDDDPRMRGLLRDALESESYRVLEASDSAALLALLDAERVDLVTLDVMLDGESGLDLVREIRRTSDIGVIMVTARDDLVDTVVGLELGADDYVTKPVKLRELVARVRSVLRRYGRIGKDPQVATAGLGDGAAEHGVELVFDRWHLFPGARALRDADGAPCELSVSEFELLVYLVGNARRALSRDEIMGELRGRDWHPSDRIVDNLVAQLRKKLERPDGPRLIRTVRGVGYLFDAEVTRP